MTPATVAQPFREGLEVGGERRFAGDPAANRAAVEVNADTVTNRDAIGTFGDEVVERTINRRDFGDDSNSARGAHR